MYSYLNKAIDKNYSSEKLKENYLKILIVLMPMVPHFAEECYYMLENTTKKFEWPEFDEKILFESKVNLVVQINGKKRGVIKIPRDLNENQILDELNVEKTLSKYLDDKEIKRKVLVPNKLINIII